MVAGEALVLLGGELRRISSPVVGSMIGILNEGFFVAGRASKKSKCVK